MQNNGRLAAALEMEALGAGELFALTDRCARHRNVSFPGHAHATLYDVGLVPGEVLRHLRSLGVEVVFQARVSGVEREGDCLQAVLCSDGRRFPANAFVDATGTAGPMANCQRYGNGCAMCVLRCPSFGGRISLTGLCGVAEWVGEKAVSYTHLDVYKRQASIRPREESLRGQCRETMSDSRRRVSRETYSTIPLAFSLGRGA